MSSLGPIQYEEPEGSVFLGRDYAKTKVLSDALNQDIDNEVKKILINAKKVALKIIKENMELLRLIKDLLLERETIVAEEIEYIEKNMKLPPKELEEQIVANKKQVNVDELLDKIHPEDTTTTKTFTKTFDDSKIDEDK